MGKAQVEDILFLGESVSSGLNYTYESSNKQSYNNLPPIRTMKDLALILETDIPTLRVFGFFRPVSKFNHYHRFAIPKKTGGERLISAPLPRLKTLQRNILDRNSSRGSYSSSCTWIRTRAFCIHQCNSCWEVYRDQYGP